MNSSRTSGGTPPASELDRATALTEVLIRTFYNEKPLRLICETYDIPPDKEHAPYINEKLDEYSGSFVRWIGSLDDKSKRRMTEFALKREICNLRAELRSANAERMILYADKLALIEGFLR